MGTYRREEAEKRKGGMCEVKCSPFRRHMEENFS